MTYQQSLENIKTLMNLICAFDQNGIFFDFSNEIEFKILFFDEKTELGKIREIVALKLRSNIPIAYISLEENGHEHFEYYDQHVDYKFNLTTSKIIHDDSNHDFIDQCPAQIKLQVAQLLAKLKQM